MWTKHCSSYGRDFEPMPPFWISEASNTNSMSTCGCLSRVALNGKAITHPCLKYEIYSFLLFLNLVTCLPSEMFTSKMTENEYIYHIKRKNKMKTLKIKLKIRRKKFWKLNCIKNRKLYNINRNELKTK